MYGCGVKLINDYTFIYSGVSSDNKTKKAHGVAICLDAVATNAWIDSGSEWQASNERIIKIRMKCRMINMTVIAVYSPVNPSNQQMNEISDKFYNDLQDVVNNVPTEDMLIIMGDFNARVGRFQQQQTAFNPVEQFTIDDENENGQKLSDLCTINNIIISNTFFQHKLIHQTSWMHPGTKKWYLLDYTLVNKKFRSSVEDVRMLRRAAGAIGTDHHLMRTKIKIHLKSRRKAVNTKKFNIDITKIKDEKAVNVFQSDLHQTISDATNDQIGIEGKHSLFLTYIKDSAKKHFQLDKATNRKRKEWLTDEILKTIDQKSLAFLQWQNHRGTNEETKYRNNYKKLRKTVKIMIERRQVEYWDEVAPEIENSLKLNDIARAFSIIRRLRGGNKREENMLILDKNGKLLVNSSDRLIRWREYFCELYNVPSNVDAKLIDDIRIPILDKNEEGRQNAQISIQEVERALNQMKSRKAPGNDEVTADLLKAGGTPVLRWLYELFTDIWKNEKMVTDWSLAILIRLYKNKGEKKLCDNYRGISLLSVISKVFSRIILNRIQILIGKQLLEVKSGFRANRSTIDQIYTLKMTMEKMREFHKPLFMCFIDITKAYDSINRELLWRVCQKYGISEKLVHLLKMLYNNSKAKVRINEELSDSFDIDNVVMQGGIPSPILFNIIFDFIIRKIMEEANVVGVKFSYGSNDFFHGDREKYETFNILTLLYADDLVAMCENADDLETFIRSFEKVFQKYGLTMNIKKNCIMTLRQLKEDQDRKVLKDQEVVHPDPDIIIRNQKVEIVDSFTYLGSNVTRDQRLDSEIQIRLAKAATAFNMLRFAIWHRKSVTIVAKLRISKACVLPVLLYGSETWSTTSSQEQRMKTFYFRCLRTIIGVNLGDRLSNEKLLDITGQPPIENIICRNRLKWFGHVNRAAKENDEASLIKKITFSYFYGEKRPRNIGIRKRWEENVMNDLETLSIKNWRRLTQDRIRWREIINKNTQARSVNHQIKEIIFEYKKRTTERRNEELEIAHGAGHRKITEVLVKNNNKQYNRPGCGKQFKPQGITNHVRACSNAKDWLKRNRIK